MQSYRTPRPYRMSGFHPGVVRLAANAAQAINRRYQKSMHRAAKQTAQAEHNLESRHGGSVYTATYQGTFGTPSVGHDAEKAAYLKAGVGIRDYVSGTVSATGLNQTLWLGHASYRPYLLLQTVCAAIVRKLYYKATNRDITNLNSVILGNADALNIAVESFDMTSARQVALITAVAGTDTLSTIAAKLTAVFVSDISNKVAREYTYVYMYNGTNEGLALSLSGMSVDICTTSHLKVQNITQEPSTADTDKGNAADVHNFPLQGVMYHGKGNFTIQKSVKELNVASGSYGTAFESDGVTGFMSPALYQATGNNSTITLGDSFRLPQVAQQFENVNASKNVKISPGVIKADHLAYSVKQKFNTFISNLIAEPDNVDQASGNIQYQRTHRGNFNLFALTELMHASSTTAVLKCWYEIWYEAYAKVTVIHEEVFMLPAPNGGTFNVIQTS